MSAAPTQRNNHLLVAEKIGHKPGEVAAGIAAEDQDNEEAADIHKVEVQQGDPTAEGQKACIHLHAVDCSHPQVPLRCDSAQTSAKPTQ